MTDNISTDDFPIKIKHIGRLFTLIRENKSKEFLEYIASIESDELDVNIRDDQNNYLIQFAIIMNNPEILKTLIKFGSKLDFLDTDGLSILYHPIRYNYPAIFDILLDENANNIGVSLIDIRDNYAMVPLHYAIRYRNIYALNKLLENNADANYKNKDQYNALHLAVVKRDIEMVKIIVKYIKNINAKTNGGDTALHQACNFQLKEIARILIENKADVNAMEFEHDFTPIFYTVALDNIDMTRLLIQHGANPNHQDYQGNTVVHYSIIYRYHHLFSIFIDSYSIKAKSQQQYHENIVSDATDSNNHINPNIINLGGDTLLHLLLYSIDAGQESIPLNQIEKILPHSNLNIQDNNGTTVLHLLTDLSLWKNFIPILEHKKLNIYIENNDRVKPIDTVPSIDREEFVDLVAKSYLYYLKTNHKTWLLSWQNDCGASVHDGVNDKSCLELIRSQIQNDKLSVPLKKVSIDVDVEYFETLEFTTFTGSILDVTIGLIYLNKKYSFSTGIYNTKPVGDINTNTNAISLKKYYQSLGISVYDYNYLFDVEILWIYQKIFFPELFDIVFTSVLKSNRKQVILIPIGIELSNGSHANYLIYWIQTFTLERFEPHGTHYPFQFNYNPALLDDLLKKKFATLIQSVYGHDPGFKYFKPIDYLPKIGFQMLDSNEIVNHRNLGDPRGFCALWTIWYTDYRLKYADLEPKKLVNKLIKIIKQNNYSFRKLIRNYSGQITNLRDEYLGKVGININEFLNDNVPFEKYVQLRNLILS
jgi:ankyrin repeat protein